MTRIAPTLLRCVLSLVLILPAFAARADSALPAPSERTPVAGTQALPTEFSAAEKAQLQAQSSALKQQASKRKNAADQEWAQAQKDCWKKFQVNSCLDQRRKQHKSEMLEVRSLEHQASDVDRIIKVREREVRRAQIKVRSVQHAQQAAADKQAAQQNEAEIQHREQAKKADQQRRSKDAQRQHQHDTQHQAAQASEQKQKDAAAAERAQQWRERVAAADRKRIERDRRHAEDAKRQGPSKAESGVQQAGEAARRIGQDIKATRSSPARQ